jgi:DNA-binding MarR family transcriptional regulator
MVHVPPHVIAQILSYAAMIKLGLAKNFGLNTSQFLTLVLVGTTRGLPIKVLKSKLSIPGSTLTSTLDSLERKKLIKRQRSKEDRRQWLLSLSAKGERLYTEILRAEGEAMSPVLERLSESERAAFIKLAEEISKPASE